MLELNQCYNMDCMEGMAQFPDGFFDLAVVDPPYFSGPERRGYYGSKVSKIGVGIYKQDRETLTYLPGAVYGRTLTSCAEFPSTTLCGAATTSTMSSHPAESCGINARKEPAFQTVSWPQLTYSTPCACSGSCGTVCCKARALPRGISCRATKS